MLKHILNEAFFTMHITTTGPLLIKSGHTTVDGPNMTPVVTFRNGEQEVFIPGSSLKGVFRSHIERVVGTLKARVVCYPFSVEADEEADQTQREHSYRESCGVMFNKIAKEKDDPTDNRRKKQIDIQKDSIYAASCPTCRLFGSTSFIGRIAINDAYLLPSTKVNKEFRDGVGIDRLTGGASNRAKFDMQVVPADTVFETEIRLRNFEIWQLGMLFLVLQDIESGLLPLGSGRSRGLGKVKAEIILEDRSTHPGGFVTSVIREGEKEEPAPELWGLGKWLDEGKDQPMQDDALLGLSFPGNGRYGTWRDDWLPLPVEVEQRLSGIRLQRIFKADALTALRLRAIDYFIRRMKAWPLEVQLSASKRAEQF